MGTCDGGVSDQINNAMQDLLIAQNPNKIVAKLATERDAHLVVIGTPSAATRQQVAQLALGDRVTFASGLPDAEYARVLASAEVAVVPSLYEGFSLPAVEHMASGTPLIASKGKVRIPPGRCKPARAWNSSKARPKNSDRPSNSANFKKSGSNGKKESPHRAVRGDAPNLARLPVFPL